MSSDLKEFVLICGIISLSLLLIIVGMATVVNHLEFRGEKAKIEAVRVVYEKSHDKNNEDVLGKVADVNSKIASNQAYNKMPIICIAIPNGWDNIEPIVVKE